MSAQASEGIHRHGQRSWSRLWQGGAWATGSAQPEEALAGVVLRPTRTGVTFGGFGRGSTWARQGLHGWRRFWLEGQAPLLVPAEAGAAIWGREFQRWPCPLHASQQMHRASVVVQVVVPSCGAP